MRKSKCTLKSIRADKYQISNHSELDKTEVNVQNSLSLSLFTVDN